MNFEGVKRAATLNDVLRKFCEMTGTTQISLDRRLRALRAARVLPSGAGRATDCLAADLVVGLLCDEEVRNDLGYVALCTQSATQIGTEGWFAGGPLAKADFNVALAILMSLIRKGVPIHINSISVMSGEAQVTALITGEFRGNFEMKFACEFDDLVTARASGTFPLVRARTIQGEVIHALAKIISDEGKEPARTRRFTDLTKEFSDVYPSTYA